MTKEQAIQHLETRIWHFKCKNEYDRLPALYEILRAVKSENIDYDWVETIGLDYDPPPITGKIITYNEHGKIKQIELIT